MDFYINLQKGIATLLGAALVFFAQAQERTFEREYTYKASEIDSKMSSRAIAITQIRVALLNEIGVYVQSESLLKTSEVGGKFSQDFVETVSTVSAGITKLVVIAEKWNGENFWMKASITIDEAILAESLRAIIQDKQKLKQMEDLQRQLNEATKEIDKLKKTLASVQVDPIKLSEKYTSEVNRLSAADFFLIGEEKSGIGNYGGAITDYSQAINLDPRNEVYFYQRGFTYDKIGNYSAAIDDYTICIDLYSKKTSLYFQDQHAHYYELRAYSRMSKGDYTGAVADFSEAITLNPKWDINYSSRAMARLEINDNAGAIQDLNTVIGWGSTDPLAFEMRGKARLRLHDNDGALMDLNKSIELKPTADAYFLRGVLNLGQNNNSGAQADMTKAIELSPKSYSAYEGRASASIGLKDYQGALEDLTTAIGLTDRSATERELARMYSLRGYTYFNLKRLNEGCRDLRRALELGDLDVREIINKYCGQR